MDHDQSLHGRKVLVVEDEAVISLMIEDMLTDLGCVVIGPAGDLQSAVTLADQAAMDVGLLDINLDGADSSPVAGKLVARGVPFVLASGYGKERARLISETAPALRKPFNSHELAEALIAALGAAPEPAR